jgi:mRNA-degrading endonuclease RelE of RelBE toxin-antitoxin system
MKVTRTVHFVRSYKKAPGEVQRAFDKQVVLLLQDLRHPSLRAKKYNEAEDKWQARVSKDWRFYFRIAGDTYVITEIISHPK